jgi:hypothetical protein
VNHTDRSGRGRLRAACGSGFRPLSCAHPANPGRFRTRLRRRPSSQSQCPDRTSARRASSRRPSHRAGGRWFEPSTVHRCQVVAERRLRARDPYYLGSWEALVAFRSEFPQLFDEGQWSELAQRFAEFADYELRDSAYYETDSAIVGA